MRLVVLLLAAGCSPINNPPYAPTVSVGPVDPGTDDDLVASIDVESVDPDGDEVTYRYTWTQAGRRRDNLATGTVPASQTTSGEVWVVTVTPNDGELDGEPATAEVTIVNTPPVATVSFRPEEPTTDDDVLAVATATDADGDAVTFTYAWTVDGKFDDTVSDTVLAADTEHGQLWAVTVTPSDAEDTGEPTTAQVVVGNTPPVMLSVELVPESPYATEDVVAVVDATDADFDAITYEYRWFVDDVEVLSGAEDTLPAGTFAKHQRISVEVVPNDGFEDGEALLSADVVALNSLPVATGARVDPEVAYEASTLTCLPEGFTDADGDAEGWTTTWTVDGKTVATGTTLDGSAFDKGQYVTCSATPFDGEENGLAVTATGLVVSNTPPVLASVALSTYAPVEGDTISVTLGKTTDVDGDEVIYGYEWYVNESLIATTSTLRSDRFAKGDGVWVVVTPYDGTDQGTPVTSDVATATNTPPAVSSVTLTPTEVYTDGTLTAAVSASDADEDTLTYTYVWYVDEVPRSGTSSSTLDGSIYFDRDQEVWVVVTPNDGEEEGDSVTSDSVVVGNTAPTAPEVAITPEDAVEGDDLTCTVTTESTDDDGDDVTYSFEWDVDGETYDGADDDVLYSVVGGGDVAGDETWTCSVTGSDGTDIGSAGEASIVTGCSMHLDFNSADYQYITVPYSSSLLLGSGDFTIEFYAAFDSDCVRSWLDSCVVVSHNNGSDYQNKWFIVWVSDWGMTLCTCDVYGALNYLLKYNDASLLDSWHHYAFVRSGSTLTLFVDGVEVDSEAMTWAVPSPTVALEIGRTESSTYLTGGLRELKISNVARYSTTFSPEDTLGADSSTLAYWPMDEGTGSTVYDESGNDHDGTIVNSATWSEECP